MGYPARIATILQNARSPYTKTFVMTSQQFKTWADGLTKMGLLKDGNLDSAIPYWNLLAGIWVITAEEGQVLTTTEAYYLAGQSKRSGQRYLGPAEDAGVVLLTQVKEDKKQKHVTLSKAAAKLVRKTFDTWAVRNGPLSAEVLEYGKDTRQAGHPEGAPRQSI